MQTASAAEASTLDRDAQAALVEAIAASADRAAFAALFRHFAPKVKGYLIKLGADRGLAEELTQEVMLTVWRKAATFDKRQASVATWLFTIARNRRIDAIRREKRPELDPSDPMLVPDEPMAADDRLDAMDREARVARAIKSLPRDQADLVHEAFYLAKSHSQIAEETKIPLGTVKSRLRLAFGRLRKAMEGREE
ncbi:MAG: sigma-70 family RNA polymerase sigma factor [Alphaproteobacteria bacterium]|nr:sigma-70 family RNA polymerase sigma factor [Alphaproteobacteria bacterium]